MKTDMKSSVYSNKKNRKKMSHMFAAASPKFDDLDEATRTYTHTRTQNV